MKNKILSYLLGGFFILVIGFKIGNINVYADCDCSDDDFSCWKVCYYESEQYKNNSCGEVPTGFVCCDGILVSAGIGCEGAVVTPEKKECKDGCCGIKLNTDFPIIGNCIESTNATSAFPTMMSALTKIVMSLILVICFIAIIVAGVLRASAGEDSSKTKTAREIIERVAITILLIGFSGVILRLVNPNFFG